MRHILGFFFLYLTCLIFVAAKRDKRWKWCFVMGVVGPATIFMISLILVIAIESTNSAFSYWLADRLYFTWFPSVGSPSFHEIKNQNGEVKEVFNQRDVI